MRFKCVKCGKCCRGKSEVKFLPEDISKLTEYLQISLEELCNRYDVESIANRLYIIHSAEQCPFVVGNLCSIESVKPLFCRLYIPLIEPEYTLTYRACPGIGQGKEYAQQDIDVINHQLCDSFNFAIEEVE